MKLCTYTILATRADEREVRFRVAAFAELDEDDNEFADLGTIYSKIEAEAPTHGLRHGDHVSVWYGRECIDTGYVGDCS